MNTGRFSSGSLRRGLLLVTPIVFALLCFASSPAWSQTWNGGTSNDWFDGTNWTGGVPTSSTDAVIDTATNNPVQLAGSDGAVSTLTIGAPSTLDILSALSVSGASISNDGLINLSGSLRLQHDVDLTGTGQLTLAGGQIGTDGNGRTLTNASTINGYGLIGSNGADVSPNLSLNNSGTIDANSSGNTLTIGGSGGSIVNSGTFEATSSGILDLASSAAISNSGGNITAGDSSTVNVSTTIEGGTLTTSNGGVMQTSGTATLDGNLTHLGAITLSDGSTYTAGSGSETIVTGTLNLGTSTGSTLALSGSLRLAGDLILDGPGSVTMTGGQIGTDGNGRTLTNDAIIQGSGLIGSNAAFVSPNLSLTNNGTIDANSGASILTIGGSGGSIINNNLFEATGGGILDLTSQAAIQNGSGLIQASGAGSTVNVSTTIEGGTLTTSSGGLLQTSGTATLDGNLTHLGAITLSDGSTYTAGAGSETIITGTLNLNSGSTLALGGQLRLSSDTTFVGPGIVVMSSTDGETGQIGTDGNGRTLNNQTTIEGSGLIGSNASSVDPNLSLNNTGTIDANANGQSLTIGGDGGSIINAGLFEATGGGILDLTSSAPVNNSGGNITADGAGSTVNVNTTIQGGTLNTLNGGVMQTDTSATLDASSRGAITLSDGSTYTAAAGTLTSITGTLNLGTSTGSTFDLGGQLRLTGNLTLSGPSGGTLVLSSTNGETGQIGTDSNGRTLTNEITIEGSGLIGSNASSVDPNLSLNNTGTIDANANGQSLTIGGDGGSIINAGLFEATGGGILDLTSSAPVNNSGGNITADGAGSTVNVNTTIQGGTLNTLNGGVMQTDTSATLDASSRGAITLSDGSTYTAAAGTLTSITGTLNLGTSTGSTFDLGGQLRLTGNLTLSGPSGGTLVLSSTNGETGQIGTDSNGRTLTNEITIEGSGLIGSDASSVSPNLSLNNSGTIDANTSGQTLSVQGTGTVTSDNLLEATNGGILNLMTSNPLNNSGGTILASDLSTVNITNSTIQGGTLSTAGSGQINIVGTSELDGSTEGAILLSDGSSLNSGAGALTKIVGTLNLGTSTGSTFNLGGQMQLVGNTTLSGPGALVMTGNPSGPTGAQIGTNGNGYTLTNQATIEGSGLIGSNLGALSQNLTVNNGVNGTILANSSGQTLQIGGTGSLTNNGTLQANAGSTLLDTAHLTNFSGTTLAGGTYNANGGTIQLNLPPNTAGGEIVNDAANIILSGATASIEDTAGHNAMFNFANIEANGSLAVLNGQVLTTNAALLTNSGMLTMGANGSQLNIVSGAYSQGGTLDEEIAGANAGQFGVVDIFGKDTLLSGSTLDVSLINGFTLANNTDYALVIMDSGGVIGDFSNVICPVGDTCNVSYATPGEVILDIDGPTVVPPPPPVTTPEGGEYGMLLACFASLAAAIKLRLRRQAATV